MSGLAYHLFFRKSPSDNLASAYQAYAARLSNIGFRLDASCQNNTQTFTHRYARLSLSLEPLATDCAQELAYGLLNEQSHLVPLLAVQRHVVTITHEPRQGAPAGRTAQICNKAIEKIHGLHRADIFCTPKLEWFDLTYSQANIAAILAAANPVLEDGLAVAARAAVEDRAFEAISNANLRAAFTSDQADTEASQTGPLQGNISATARGTLWCSAFAFTIALAPQSVSASPWVEMTARVIGMF